MYGWFWPHGIWLQSKIRNETTSANRQENRGLDSVVPQRINALSSCFSLFLFHFVHTFCWSFLSFWCRNEASIHKVWNVDICTFISIKRQTLVRSIRYIHAVFVARASLMQTKNNWQKRMKKQRGYQMVTNLRLYVCSNATYADYNNQINSNAQPAHTSSYKADACIKCDPLPSRSTNVNTMKNWSEATAVGRTPTGRRESEKKFTTRATNEKQKSWKKIHCLSNLYEIKTL